MLNLFNASISYNYESHEYNTYLDNGIIIQGALLPTFIIILAFDRYLLNLQ